MNENIFKQKATLQGVTLGLLRMIGFELMIICMATSSDAMKGYNSLLLLLLSLGSLGISILIPFLAGKYAINYRRNFCGNTMNYIQAFKYIAVMYICSALVFALFQALYFRIFDNGAFVNSYQAFISTMSGMNPNDTQALENFEAISEQMKSFKSTDFVFSTLLSNLFSALYMPALIALFVRTKPQQQ